LADKQLFLEALFGVLVDVAAAGGSAWLGGG